MATKRASDDFEIAPGYTVGFWKNLKLGFREGLCDHSNQSKRVFIAFLKDWDAFIACLPPNSDPDALAKKIYQEYRCALHHSGGTVLCLFERPPS